MSNFAGSGKHSDNLSKKEVVNEFETFQDHVRRATGLNEVKGTRAEDLWSDPTAPGTKTYPSNHVAITAALKRQTADYNNMQEELASVKGTVSGLQQDKNKLKQDLEA